MTESVGPAELSAPVARSDSLERTAIPECTTEILDPSIPPSTIDIAHGIGDGDESRHACDRTSVSRIEE